MLRWLEQALSLCEAAAVRQHSLQRQDVPLAVAKHCMQYRAAQLRCLPADLQKAAKGRSAAAFKASASSALPACKVHMWAKSANPYDVHAPCNNSKKRKD